MRWSSTPSTYMWLDGHRHDVTAEERLFGVGRRLDLDVARQQSDFAALVHVEGDLAEVHVLELLVERDLVAADGGNRAPLGLPGIVVRRREDDLVAHAPFSSIQDLYRRAACLSRARKLGPGVLPVTVQVQRAARDHDPAVTHARHDVFIRDFVGKSDRRVARVGARFAADGELAVQHDPFGGQLQVGIVRKSELAIDGHTAERGRTDVEDHFFVARDRDLVACDRHLAVWPGVRIGPLRRRGRRRSSLSLSDSGYAAEQECRNER